MIVNAWAPYCRSRGSPRFSSSLREACSLLPRTLRRHRPPPAGRSGPPPPLDSAGAPARAPRPPARTPGLQQDLRVRGRRGRQFAGAAGGHWLLRPRVPDGRAAPGCRWLRPSVLCEGGEQRGVPARIALSGRGRRSMRARARGRPGPHPTTRGTGKKDSTQRMTTRRPALCLQVGPAPTQARATTSTRPVVMWPIPHDRRSRLDGRCQSGIRARDDGARGGCAP